MASWVSSNGHRHQCPDPEAQLTLKGLASLAAELIEDAEKLAFTRVCVRAGLQSIRGHFIFDLPRGV
jgi:hypothetical protein